MKVESRIEIQGNKKVYKIISFLKLLANSLYGSTIELSSTTSGGTVTLEPTRRMFMLN